MSKDIRSYFSKGSGNSVKSPQLHSPNTKKRSRRVIDSDDEDDFKPNQTSKKQKELEVTAKSKSQKKKPEVVVQVEDFFGSTPVLQKKQAAATKNSKSAGDGSKVSEIKPVKNEKNKSGSKKKKTEGGEKDDAPPMFECDDELEASLLQTSDEHLMPHIPSTSKTTKSGRSGSVTNGEKSSPDKKKAGTSHGVGSSVKIKTPEKETVKEKKQNKTPDSKLENNSIINSDQKRRNAEAYQKYLQRSGPKNPGSKNIPEGTPTCLQGLTFVITGVLDSLEREEASEIIQKCGGRVTSQVSKKTDYVVIGEEPGVSKLEKADKFGTKRIHEDDLLNMIREKSGMKEEKEDDCIKGTPEKTSKYFNSSGKRKHGKDVEEVKDELSEPSSKIFKKEERKAIEKDEGISKTKKTSPIKTKNEPLQPTQETEKQSSKELRSTTDDLLWVDKYRPKSTKNILGQAGDKSNVKKLIKWLQNWHKFHSNKKEKKPSRPAPWNQNDDGSYYKAALLSGPPGVGKTTSIHLVCEELGLDIIEFNASDTRSKRLLQEEVSELLSTKSIRGFLQGSGESFQKHVLVMDEVDGMAGNEDRGGIQELIQLIKNTKVPIIGICNDRSHPKMRSLVNYCFDLRFQRPRLEQIKGAMKSICFKENLNISGEALEELIVSSNHDVRQVLHSLSMLASGDKNLSIEEAKKSGEQSKKPLNLSPWDVVRKVFSASEQEKMSFTDKTDLFFQDYSLGPLFVQDSYLRVKPYKANNCKKKKLELISKAAESLAIGDVIEKTIRSQNAWSLLPVQAIFSSVLPGHHMSGHVQGQIQFPVWLGKNSKRNKFDRLLQELHSSLRLSVTGTKESINLDYLNQLKDVIVRPLKTKGLQGVEETLKFMLEYNLTKEDLDHILELTTWPGMKDSFSEVDSKVKAALTRTLNKECQRVSHIAKTKTKIKGDGEVEGGEDGQDEEENDESDDNIDLDPMIKKGKPKKSKEDTANKGSQTKKQGSKSEKSKGKH